MGTLTPVQVNFDVHVSSTNFQNPGTLCRRSFWACVSKHKLLVFMLGVNSSSQSMSGGGKGGIGKERNKDYKIYSAPLRHFKLMDTKNCVNN